MGIETTLKNSNNDFDYFRWNFANFHFLTVFLKEISIKIETGRKWCSEYSKFLKLCILGIETTLKIYNNYSNIFSQIFDHNLLEISPNRLEIQHANLMGPYFHEKCEFPSIHGWSCRSWYGIKGTGVKIWPPPKIAEKSLTRHQRKIAIFDRFSTFFAIFYINTRRFFKKKILEW